MSFLAAPDMDYKLDGILSLFNSKIFKKALDIISYTYLKFKEFRVRNIALKGRDVRKHIILPSRIDGILAIRFVEAIGLQRNPTSGAYRSPNPYCQGDQILYKLNY